MKMLSNYKHDYYGSIVLPTVLRQNIKHQHNRTGILIYCSAIYKSIYIVVS